ncbi:EVE domain-containing protein [Rhodobacter sp. 24-YEA-8]|uniref:EVE domain-containing protein n=1 Tax=Rhodobacter sp. 24-YEA-8 TaxID=1884310 RepID=UPI0008955022|nr:EVE domain-containing protein [Rhodobacter sp. 24-YEA-8]SEC67147.1 Predicted RNA-binding protein, contains PUA-like domain [Rhodobacter sp. 24-YEA-8]
MNYWLFKSEPDTWSWDAQVAKGDVGEEWNGVRNYQARNNMRAMKIGDRGFFYHSNIGKEVVGIVEVCRESAPDSTTEDPRWDCVWIRAIKPLTRHITLDEAKVTPGLEQMVLVNNTRLSVQPVSPAEWEIICLMGGVEPY